MGSELTEPGMTQEKSTDYSSAGLPTQRFSPVAPEHQQQVPNQRNTAVALVLLVVGLLMLVGRIGSAIVGSANPALPPVPPVPPMPPMPPMPGVVGASDFAPAMVLLTIASCLLFFAFWRRLYGLMIPGCLLVGLSVGVTFMQGIGPAAVLWGLSLGFLAILVLGRRLFNVHNVWPIFPAVPLFGVGVIAALMEEPGFFVANMLLWLPLLLIGVGLYLGWGRRALA